MSSELKNQPSGPVVHKDYDTPGYGYDPRIAFAGLRTGSSYEPLPQDAREVQYAEHYVGGMLITHPEATPEAIVIPHQRKGRLRELARAVFHLSDHNKAV